MVLVTGAMGSLLLKLGELLKDEYDLQKGVRKKIECLTRELESVHGVLRMVGEVPPEQLNEPVKLWARDLREASYDMEDIIDGYLVRIDGPEPTDHTHMLRHLRKNVAKLFKKTKARRKIAGAIRDINERLQEVAARRGRYTVNDNIPKLAVTTTVDPRLQAMYKNASELVGMEGQMNELVKMLSLGVDIDLSDKTMKMVSIFGLGGLGKTTLARAVYDKFELDFDCRAFVPVGQNPDRKKVLRDILIDLDNKRYINSGMTMLDERQLIDRLREFLQKTRCFIVIDDIWDKKLWGLIRCALQDNNCGSRVVTTTRIFEVATYVGDIYKMQPLSHDDSKKILYTRIVGSEGESFPSSSAKACDKILKKCGGVPLAIITIASLLANKPCEYWPEVYNSIGLGPGGNDDVENTRKILSLSYYDLPLHLKPCLLYLSIFPEDCYIEKDMLIWKWIAEGFVHVEQAANIGLFETGERYFEELINRSMIQPIENESEGYVVDGCHVHDMVLDLIRLMSAEENIATVLDGGEQNKLPRNKARRLALQRQSFKENGQQLSSMGLKQLRSFVMSECYDISVEFQSFQVLRVLAIEKHNTWDYDSRNNLQHVGSLLHLRYLGLQSSIFSSTLPAENVGHLKFLQVLDLSGSKIQKLPESVGQLTKLLCLRCDVATRVLPSLIGKLTSLQDLWIYPHFADARQFVKVLGKLSELRVLRTGSFSFLSFLDIRPDERIYRDLLVSLCNLHKIQIVNIVSDFGRKGVMWEADFTSYPQHLRFLRLIFLKFHRIPAWIDSSLLPKLCCLELCVQILKVRDMEVLGRLPELYYLQLDVAEYTETVSTDKTDGNGYFRKLRFCHTPFLFLWFDLHDGIMCKNKSIMPNLESLKFLVNVRVLKDANPHVGFGKLLSLGHLGTTSLQRVEADICCLGALATEVEEAEVALPRAAAVHPNHPTINTTRTKQGGMIYHYHCEDFSCSQLGARRIIPKAVVKNVHARLMMDEYGYCDFHWLLQNPHAEKFSVTIGCEDAALEEVEETEVAARCAVHDHPNHPTLEIVRRDEDKMVTFDRGQEPDVVHRHARARPTLDPEFDPPRFRFLDGDSQRFKWLRKIEFVEKFILSINCENASLEEVEKTEAAAKYTVDRHPNRPILELMRYNEDKMVLSDQHQKA